MGTAEMNRYLASGVGAGPAETSSSGAALHAGHGAGLAADGDGGTANWENAWIDLGGEG
jgi:hypothetical protein